MLPPEPERVPVRVRASVPERVPVRASVPERVPVRASVPLRQLMESGHALHFHLVLLAVHGNYVLHKISLLFFLITLTLGYW